MHGAPNQSVTGTPHSRLPQPTKSRLVCIAYRWRARRHTGHAGALCCPLARSAHGQHAGPHIHSTLLRSSRPCTVMDGLLTGGEQLARPRSHARCSPRVRASASGPCAPAPPRARAPCRRAPCRRVVPRRPCVLSPTAPCALSLLPRGLPQGANTDGIRLSSPLEARAAIARLHGTPGPAGAPARHRWAKQLVHARPWAPHVRRRCQAA